MDVKIHDSRKQILSDEFHNSYFADIKNTLLEEKKLYTIFPPAKLWFAAFDMTPFDEVKVVILWQDPYHWPWQAMWLSFSVPDWVSLPPSLKNIYKEIVTDIWWEIDTNILSGDLTWRAKQWVLLLNAFLTVRAGQPASHQNIWRENFTDAVIQTISDQKEHIVFILRWNFARNKKHLIDANKHLILEAAHPSPFSAHSWFFGCKHFSQTNKYLMEHWITPIQWL